MSAPKNFKRFLLTSYFGRILLIPYRFLQTFRCGGLSKRRYWSWLLFEREVTNYSYRLTQRSKQQLCHFVDIAVEQTSGTAAQSLSHFEGGLECSNLVSAIDSASARSAFRWSQNKHALLDQRIVYYLLTRALKPKLVFQSGTARGVGACLIAMALIENESDGQPGRLITTDIDPEQGYAIEERLKRVVTFIAQDSVVTLSQVTQPIDLFIHDTSPGDLAVQEFAVIERRIAKTGFVLSTWHTATTRELAKRLDRRYLTWKDEPDDHWYQGTTMALICGREQ